MLISVTSWKGGVGKTTTSIHLAGAFRAAALSVAVLDGDPQRSALEWAREGERQGTYLPFEVLPERTGFRRLGEFDHAVLDTAAHPTEEELEELVGSSSLLIVPSEPDALSLRSLLRTVGQLRKLDAYNYRVLLTKVPPSSRAGMDARTALEGEGVPLFRAEIRGLAVYKHAALAGRLAWDIKNPMAERAYEDYCNLLGEICLITGSKV